MLLNEWPKRLCRMFGAAKPTLTSTTAARPPPPKTPPLPREGRRGEHAHAEGDEARLREREQQAPPGRGDDRRQAEGKPRPPRREDDHEAGEDRDDEEPAVDGRVPKDRVDAVER